MLSRLWCFLFGCITMKDVFTGTAQVTSPLTGELHTRPITRLEKREYCPRCTRKINWAELGGENVNG